MSVLGVPRLVRGILERPRLTALLEDPYPLIVVHGPMGYGKTVLMAQWARSTPREGVWMRVREGNEDPLPFVRRLAMELGDLGFLDPENPLTDAAAALGVGVDPWELLIRGVRRIPGDIVLAIDEGDRLSEATIAGIVQLVADVPTLSVRITARASSRFTEPALAVLLDATSVGPEMLALTVDEAEQLLADAALARELVERGGAPALARMLALQPSTARVGGSGERAMSDVAQSLLRVRANAWTPEFVQFLKRAAVADTLDAALAIELTGDTDAPAMLDVAEREGLGSWSTPGPRDGRAVFVFSPFLRLAAESSLREQYGRAEVRELVLRVARWERDNGLPYPALRRAVESADWELASDIARTRWWELLTYGARLRSLFRSVPLLTLRSYPLIAMMLAISANADGAHRLRALEYFALAAYGARVNRSKVRPADRVLLRTIETASQRVSGRAGAVQTAQEVYETMLSMGPEERDALGVNESTIFNQVGISLFYGGRPAEALDCFRRSLAVGDAKGLKAGLQGLALAAGTMAVGGDIVDAQTMVDQGRTRTWPDRWITGYQGSFYQLARAFIALEGGDVAGADAALATLARHRTTIEYWALLAHVEVVIGLMRHRPDEMRVRLDTIVAEQSGRYATMRFTSSRLSHTRSLVLLAGGDVSGAEKAVIREPDGRRKAVSLARAAIAAGDPERALRLLRSHAGHDETSRLQAEAQALEAAAVAMHDPDDPAAGAAVRRLRVFLLDRGMTLPLVFVPVRGLEALQRADADGEFAEVLGHAREIALIPSGAERPALTPRELAVANELARFETVAQIAEALVVSPNTVKSQLRSLYRKLGVSSRLDALRALSAMGVTGADRG